MVTDTIIQENCLDARKIEIEERGIAKRGVDIFGTDFPMYR